MKGKWTATQALPGGDLYEAEVVYLIAYEWAVTAEDVLWRRSKLGLYCCEAEIAALDAWMKNYHKFAAIKTEDAAFQGVQ